MNNKIVKSTSGGDSPAMDQVRDLLFGTQIKEIDTRLQRQEERFARSLEDVKGLLKGKIDSLESFMKSEVSSLLTKIKDEQFEREESTKKESKERQLEVANLVKELANINESFERKINKIAVTLENTERELRQLIMTENNSLSNKVEEKYQDSLSVLRNTAEQIRSDMVYRAALASMFTETALKLNGQWQSDIDQVDEATITTIDSDRNF